MDVKIAEGVRVDADTFLAALRADWPLADWMRATSKRTCASSRERIRN